MFLILMKVKLKRFQFELCLCELFSPLLGASHMYDLSVFQFLNAFTFGSFLDILCPMASLLSRVLDVPCKLLVCLDGREWGNSILLVTEIFRMRELPSKPSFSYFLQKKLLEFRET